MKVNVNNIIVFFEKDQDVEIKKELIKNGIAKNNIKKYKVIKKSIDARKKSNIKFVYNIQVELKKEVEFKNSKNIFPVKDKKIEKKIAVDKKLKILIIGAGPSGLFAALRLVEHGYKPIIIDKGEDIDNRDKTIKKFIETGELNENSNIQFGEGGAGTYSDGKLNTRIKSPYIDKVFLEFIECGAENEIFWENKPHIGTDRLKVIIKNLRKKIISLGGTFYFRNELVDIVIEEGKVRRAIIKNNKNEIENLEVERIILGTGHSSRDTYRMLNKHKIAMENKAFAVGARIEHLRKDIDKMQFGKFAGDERLGAATYNFTYNNREEGRGIFSFCMCPGGVIVNAASNINGTLVNGMSYSQRDGRFSNSAVVVGIKEDEFGTELFSGMKFQEKLEKKTYELVKNYGALYQSVPDFLEGKITKGEIETSYEMKKIPYDLNELFPEVISRNMKKALLNWGKQNEIFISKKANLIAPETRTSSPVRIIRNEKGESINIKGLYPIGEGAGYAGGIMSAAVDGIRIVELSFLKEA